MAFVQKHGHPEPDRVRYDFINRGAFIVMTAQFMRNHLMVHDRYRMICDYKLGNVIFNCM